MMRVVVVLMQVTDTVMTVKMMMMMIKMTNEDKYK